MKRILLAFLYCLLIGVRFPSLIFANPLLNEFSSSSTNDWIEFYNPTQEEIALSDYYIRDTSQTNKLILTGVMSPGSVMVFDWSDKLNNAGDTIKLFKGSEDYPFFELSYGTDTYPLPVGNQTLGRKNDDNNTFVLFETATKGTANLATVINTPTPTSLPTATQTPTPTPLKEPTPTRTPTPTRIPTPTKLQSTAPVRDEGVSTGKKVTSAQIKNIKSSPIPTAVLGTKDINAVTDTPSPKKENLVKGQSSSTQISLWTVVPIGGGVIILIACAILFFFNYRSQHVSE